MLEISLFASSPDCYAVYKFLAAQERYQSSYVGNLARRVRDADEASEVAHLKELCRRNDPEAVIRLFETQPSLHHNATALSEYVKALVKVDRLDESELLKTLQRGEHTTSILFGQFIRNYFCLVLALSFLFTVSLIVFYI